MAGMSLQGYYPPQLAPKQDRQVRKYTHPYVCTDPRRLIGHIQMSSPMYARTVQNPAHGIEAPALELPPATHIASTIQHTDANCAVM